MNSWMKKIAVASLASILVVSAFAQGGGGAGGGRGQGAGGRGQGGMGRGGGGDATGLNTLQRADVQKELNVTAEQKTKIEALAAKNRQDMQAMRDSMQNGGGDAGNMREMMDKANEKTKKELAGIISAEQLKRLKEIQIQLMGGRALLNAEVQKELGITDSQKSKLEAVQATQRDKMQEMMQGGQVDRTQMQEMMTKINAEISAEMIKVLTSEQKTKFEAMKGKAFKADPNERGAGFGGRGGGGGGGGRGGTTGGGI